MEPRLAGRAPEGSRRVQPSATAAGATADRSKSQEPSRSGNALYPSAAPVNAGGGAGASGKWGRFPANSPMSELAKLMEEPAGGPNEGRRSSDNPNLEGRHLPLGADEWQAAEFMRGGGWTVVTAHERGWTAGMHAHRGVVHPDDHVDEEALRSLVEAELGFTFEQLHSVYRTGGRIPSEKRELRVQLDARLLALSRSGANMDLFGRVTGLNGSTVDRALARARAEEGTR